VITKILDTLAEPWDQRDEELQYFHPTAGMAAYVRDNLWTLWSLTYFDVEMSGIVGTMVAANEISDSQLADIFEYWRSPREMPRHVSPMAAVDDVLRGHWKESRDLPINIYALPFGMIRDMWWAAMAAAILFPLRSLALGRLLAKDVMLVCVAACRAIGDGMPPTSLFDSLGPDAVGSIVFGTVRIFAEVFDGSKESDQGSDHSAAGGSAHVSGDEQSVSA
jgi:hypothetical protein